MAQARETALEVEEALVTAAGYDQLRAELAHLRTAGRAEIGAQLRQALDDGSRDDPALYDLFEAQAQLEDRIAVLEGRLGAARIVEPASDGVAGVGSRVRVRDRESGEAAEYELVGAIESDVGNGRVSVGAPVGRALLGVRRGDSVAVDAPRGSRHLDVLDVRTAAPNSTASQS